MQERATFDGNYRRLLWSHYTCIKSLCVGRRFYIRANSTHTSAKNKDTPNESVGAHTEGVRLRVVVLVVLVQVVVASTWTWISWISLNRIHSAFPVWTEERAKERWTNECLLVDFVFQGVHRTHVKFRLVSLWNTGVWKLSMVTNAGVASSSIQRWWPTLVGCPTSQNMGYVPGQSGPDAPCSAHWTPNQRCLTRWLAFDSCHANHKHNHNH